jgi:predicted flap endonuclease-1-like 5' DNA nuclease
MKVTDRWDGAGTPFQGDRTLRLLAIPAGARIVSARARVRPLSADPAAPFVERLSLEPGAAPGAGAVGVVQERALEIDLRGRRTLHALEGTGLAGARVAVDPGGGIFVPVSAGGTLGGTVDAPLRLTASGSLPGIAATRLRLAHDTAGAPAVSAVLVRSLPAGLTLRVGGLPPFWAHPGELADEAATPDFAPLLGAWLAEQGKPENGYTAVPLVLHSESLARLELVVEVEVRLEATLLPGGMPEATLPFDLSSLAVAPRGADPSGDLVARLPAGAAALPGETRLRVRGAFAETRAVAGRGPTGVIDPVAAKGRALVSPAFAQAQEVPAGAGAVIVGVDLLLRPLTRAAVLQVDLRGDAGGRPDRESLLPQAARVAIRESADPAAAAWAGAVFAAPLTIDPCRRYWLVLQAVEGEAEWVAYRGDSEAALRLDLAGGAACPPAGEAPSLQGSDDGGASWRAGGRLIALYRLRALPARWEVPLEVEVGRGLDATRISLDRFGPLARVDFTVDDEALAHAVTRHARGPADGCAPGEALADGGFRRWTAQGEGMEAPVPLRGMDGIVPLRAAAGVDGRWAYLLAAAGEKAVPVLLRVDVPADVVVDQAALDPAAPLPADDGGDVHAACALVVHPDGARAFVLTHAPTTERALLIQSVELEDGRAAPPRRVSLSGDAHLPGFPLPAAVSPDGGTLWVGSGGTVAGLSTDALAEGGTDAALVVFRHSFPGERVACLAVSPDGARLCVGMAFVAEDRGRLRVVDVSGSGGATETVAIPGLPRDVAVTPDGGWAVVAHDKGAALVDLARMAVLPVTAKEARGTVSVVLEPGGRRAWFGADDGLGVLDLQRRTLLFPSPPEIGGTPAVLAATPQGDRLYAVLEREVLAIPLGTRRLELWTAESGRMEVGPPRDPRARGVVLRAGDEGKADPAVLSQTVAVSAACRYVFAFAALASPGSHAVAELLWVGPQGEPLEPLQLPLAEGAGFGENDGARTLRPHRRVVLPPAGAAGVEVRFRVPVGAAEVAEASLAVSADLLVNGDLRLPLLGEDGGWTVGPEARAAVVRALPAGGTRVTGVGPGAAQVAQEMGVRPGVPLALRMEGRAWSAPAGAVPSLCVTWKDAAGGAAGVPAVLSIHPDDFVVHAMRLDPPAGAVRVRVALVLPPRSALQAERLTLLPAPEVDVPVRFVARAPGELTLLDARIVYEPGGLVGVRADGDVLAPSPSAPPADGVAAGAGHGVEADDDCCCDDEPASAAPAGSIPRVRTVPIAAPRVTAATRWHPPVQGVAAPPVTDLDAGEEVDPVGQSTEHAEAPDVKREPDAVDDDTPVPDGTAKPPPTDGRTPAVGPAPGGRVDGIDVTLPPADFRSVREVSGVGEIRGGRFEDHGIWTLEQLASATLKQLDEADPTLSAGMAAALIARAAALLTPNT